MVQGPGGWQRCRLALLLFFLSVPLASAADDDGLADAAGAQRPIVFGILPFISPIALLKRFAPLRDYLSEQTGRTVLLETARDYPEFLRRTNERRYDMIITAPHFVIQALKNHRYEIRATYSARLEAVVLVSARSPVTSLAQLAGQPVATPPTQAIVTWIGEDLLRRQTAPGPEPVYRPYPSHNAAYSAVAAGETAAAVVVDTIFTPQQLAHDGLRVLGRGEPFPAMGILMASDLPETLRDRLTSSLVDMDQSEAGRAVLTQIGHPGYRRADINEFEALRPYLPRVRALLEQQP